MNSRPHEADALGYLLLPHPLRHAAQFLLNILEIASEFLDCEQRLLCFRFFRIDYCVQGSIV